MQHAYYVATILVSLFLMLNAQGSDINFVRKTVFTSHGVLIGADDDYDTTSFKGIPYAKAPVGDLRFKAPRNPNPWVFPKKAQEFKPPCKQMGNIFVVESSADLGKPFGDEDCLYLNVWTKKNDNMKKPIFFWIHGGSNYKGKSSDPNYRGAYFANRHDAVYVSVNYRLGHFGAFLNKYTDSANELDHSPNLVTLDLIAALKWIKANAGSFGGDENNITIAGQSAGCMNVWGLVQSPMAKDLFHKAICSAGLPNTYPMVLAQKKTDLILEKLIEKHFPGEDAKEFIKSKSKKWLDEFLLNVPSNDIVDINLGPVPFQHFSDGIVLPRTGWAAFLSGNFNRVPMILGGTKDEFSAAVAGATLRMDISELYDIMSSNDSISLEYDDLISMKSKKEYSLLVQNGSATLHSLIDAINSYVTNFIPALYRYHFEWNQLPVPWNRVLGSLHGMDAIFYLGNFESERPNFTNFAWTNENKDSREKMREDFAQYINGFIHSGNPNQKIAEHLPKWPQWNLVPLKKRRLILDEKTTTRADYVHYPISVSALDQYAKYIYDFYDSLFYRD